MKSSLLFLVITVAVFSSCTSAYKTGQTPDDVYYSEPRAQDEYVEVDKRDGSNSRYYRNYDDYYNDRYLRMKVRNRNRWDDLNDWYYYERNMLGFNVYNTTLYNPCLSWNYFYNPYYQHFGFASAPLSPPKTITRQPKVITNHFNLAGYTNNNYNNSNSIRTKSGNTSSRSSYTQYYNNSNKSSQDNRSRDGFSNTIRTIFSGSGGSSRSYSPSSSGSESSGVGNSGGSSGGSSGGGGGISRPQRGNN